MRPSLPSATNPYIIDGPLEAGDPFIGRERVFAWVQASLEAGENLKAGSRLLALYGLPYTGKTSLLRRLPQRLGKRYLYVFNDISEISPWHMGAWAARLRRDVAAVLQAAGHPWPEAASPAPDATKEAAWEGLAAALEENTLLLLVDGLSLADKPEKWQPLVAWLRELVSWAPVRALMAWQGHVAQAAEPANAALADIPSFAIGYLSEREVEQALVETGRGRLRYDYDAARQVHAWSGGHPFLVQLFGHALFERCAAYGRVEIHDVDHVREEVQRAAGPLFEQTWATLSPAAKVALSALGERRGRHNLFTRRDVQDFLRWKQLQVPEGDIPKALDELTAKGLLIRLGTDSYDVPVPLLTQWVAATKQVPAVAREVKRYRQAPPAPDIQKERKPIRWVSIFSWALSIVIIALIALAWQSRDLPPEPAAGETPEAAADARLIAYASKETQESDGDIVVAAADGSEPVPLTEDLGDNSEPAWSPDGERILFVSNRSGNKEIWAMNADGKRPRNLTRSSDDDWMPAWSPDGKSIAFSSYRDGNWEIYTSRDDGSRPVRLTNDPAADVAPSWSPDGQRIAFASYRDGNWELYLMDRDGSNLQRLTQDDATDYAPEWSPSGELIAFETYRDGNMEIYVMAPDGTGLRNLTQTPAANDHGPAWSAEGDRLLYYSNLDGGWDIFVIGLDGSGKKNLTRSKALEREPSWQP